MHETVIAMLTETGMTRNEALAYVTLLEDDSTHGLTGYEVAARSRIPPAGTASGSGTITRPWRCPIASCSTSAPASGCWSIRRTSIW